MKLDPTLSKKLYDLDADPKFNQLTESQLKEKSLGTHAVVDLDRLYHIYLRNGFSVRIDELCPAAIPTEDNPYTKQDFCSGIWIKPSFFNHK